MHECLHLSMHGCERALKCSCMTGKGSRQCPGHLTIDDLCATPTLDLQGSFCLGTSILLHAYLTEGRGCMWNLLKSLQICRFYSCHRSFDCMLRVLQRVNTAYVVTNCNVEYRRWNYSD